MRYIELLAESSLVSRDLPSCFLHSASQKILVLYSGHGALLPRGSMSSGMSLLPLLLFQLGLDERNVVANCQWHCLWFLALEGDNHLPATTEEAIDLVTPIVDFLAEEPRPIF